MPRRFGVSQSPPTCGFAEPEHTSSVELSKPSLPILPGVDYTESDRLSRVMPPSTFKMEHRSSWSSSSSTHHHSKFVQRHSMGTLPTHVIDEFVTETLQQRLSAPVFPQQAIAGFDVPPENVLMRTNVHITEVVPRDNHIAYAIEVDTGLRKSIIYKRFSEIRAFRVELLDMLVSKKAHCGSGPCTQLHQLTQVKFPKRKLIGRRADIEVAHERSFALERFLQATLRVYRMATRRHMRCCVNGQCVMLDYIRGFLGINEQRRHSDPAVNESCHDPHTVEVHLLKPAPSSAPMKLSVGSDAETIFEHQELYAIMEDAEHASPEHA
ncbi:hypothetical protein Poli38472_006148 [Pythium oligandrum]|uniref:PX domain-containing protein n=1 Tax=Pythium oligandrum TaxID=41045 RepID=A0A8K1CSD4_PYTOL|nr:hypothetical protein Poli38472_006148 [Pythium oligandrum]|eukprot:TMW68680.1 hypothetical protein Poli38472_006148 [Pythium oligandrum]